ncbi:MAG: hypothetical protein JWR17_408 [Pseudomonas sp.]|nr:hypothetical protein [Pseudomonas sp.]
MTTPHPSTKLGPPETHDAFRASHQVNEIVKLMSDSHTEEAAISLSSKQEYENAINLSQHVSQAKTVSEMVLDAFHTAKESDQIRQLRAAIRQAQDSLDDDKAYELMGELKQLKDEEAADSAALADLSTRFSISRILSSFKDDPGFQELVYSLALKVLNQTHQAVSNPTTSKSKAVKARKEIETFTLSKEGVSFTLPLRSPRIKPNVDREVFEFLGFEFVGDGDLAELQSENFVDNEGNELPATRKNIITAIQQRKAFDGYHIA